MPTARKLLAGLALALTAVSCSDDKGPTAPDQQAPNAAVQGRAALLTNVPVSGTRVIGGAPFNGTLTVTSFRFDQTTNRLLASGTVTSGGQTGTFTDEVVTLATSPTAPRCPVLTLDVGRIFLDLLGLEVDLAPISLDITAVSGPGNLLGNLLCSLVGLLDPLGPLAQILNLIERINAILAGL
jgi:hypothetical protein